MVLLYYGGDMDTQLVKTTIQLEPELLYQAKMIALQERTSLRLVINRGLAHEIYGDSAKGKTKLPKIGGYRLGGIRGNLRRTDIYSKRETKYHI